MKISAAIFGIFIFILGYIFGAGKSKSNPKPWSDIQEYKPNGELEKTNLNSFSNLLESPKDFFDTTLVKSTSLPIVRWQKKHPSTFKTNNPGFPKMILVP